MALTTHQQAVLAHVEGHQLVLAGPGSGKTHTLIEKICHIFDQQIIPEPYGLLAVTFSNAAVTEINTRLWDKSFRHWDRVFVQTFHGFANYLLRCYGSDVGIREDFAIIDRDERLQFLRELLLQHSSEMKLSDFDRYIQQYKRQGIYPGCDNKFVKPGEKRFQAAYADYQNRLSEHNQLDFDDLIHFAINLMRESSLANDLFTNYFKYIMVDEFQDTDLQQLEMIELFTETAIGSTVFADDDQAIYSFRGGNKRNVETIKQKLQANLTTLPENFRSPAIIVEAAQSLISQESNRLDKFSVAMSDEKGTLSKCEFTDDHAEATAVSRWIADLQDSQVIADLGQMAVVARNRKRSIKVKKALEKIGIAWFDRSRLSFTDTWEANVTLAILGLSCDIDSSDGLYPLMTAIENSGISYQLNDKDAIDISSEIREKLLDSFDIENHPDNAWGILEKSGFPELLQQIAANSSEYDRLIKNVRDVASCIQKEAENRNYDLHATIDMISGRNAVQLITSHGSKGKEFDYVFFVGVEDDVIPQSWRNPSDEEISEERRIFYVTITRARKEVYFTSAKRVKNFPKKNPSRFLDEIPQEYFTYLTDSMQNLV